MSQGNTRENYVTDPSRKDVQKNKSLPQSSTGTVSALYARALLDYVRSIGLDPYALFEPQLVDHLNNSENRISIANWRMMLEDAIAKTGDVDLPLKAAELFEPKHFGMYGFAMLSSPTLKDVIAILVQFEPIIADINTTTLVENGDDVELHWKPLLAPPLPMFIQQSFVCWQVVARQIASKVDQAREVHFSFEQPENIETYQRIFGCKLYFNAPISKIVFHKSILEYPIPLSDPATNNVLLAQVEKKLQAHTQPDLLVKLREFLTANLASNQISIHDAASAIGISPRTLQYQLNEHDIGFRNLLEQIRQEQAERYLSTTDLSLNEIAYLLGYSEQSPFQNAFRRWTGESPGSFRKKAGK